MRFWCSGLILILMCHLVHASDRLRVAVPQEGYPPYIIVKGNVVEGILIDTLKAAARAAYIELDFLYLPEKRSQAMLDTHEIDVRMESPGWVDNPDQYLWSEPITSIKDMLVFHRTTPNVFENDDAMVGAVINTHLGYSYPTLQTMFDNKSIQRQDFATEQAMLLNLIREQDGVIKAAVMDEHVVQYLMGKMPSYKTELVMSHRHVDYKYLHFQFFKNQAMKRIVLKLNLEITKLKRKGTVDKIIKDTLKANDVTL